MFKQRDFENIKFGGSADYRLVVNGVLTPRNISDLQAMGVAITFQQYEPALTQLNGTLADQTALSGLLNTLYETHLTIVTVELLNQSGSESVLGAAPED